MVRDYPSFPVVVETFRSCLQDALDVPSLRELLRALESGRMHVDEIETRSASPFARSLVFTELAAHIYDNDAPAAERRSQALNLDPKLLRELLGPTEVRALLDPAVLGATEAELQGLTEPRRARQADELHDLLRVLGDLGEAEIELRCTEPPGPWLRQLSATGQALERSVGGELRWIAAEDRELYERALSLHSADPEARAELGRRWARRRGPFAASQFAHRFGLSAEDGAAVLAQLVLRAELVSGAFRPGGEGSELCHPEVLRKLRRRTLDRLRAEVAPVPAQILGLFLPRWHGVAGPAAGTRSLDDALDKLEGLPTSFVELERLMLPARMGGYHGRLLDERGARGELVWIGAGALRHGDGRVRLLRRNNAALLGSSDPTLPDSAGVLHQAVLDYLANRGASFFGDLCLGCGDATAGSVEQALWDLAWAGLVTNDTFAPLRSRASGVRQGTRVARRALSSMLGGRWTLCAQPSAKLPSPTAQAHARALMLLARYGVVSREMALLEDLPGGFGPIYQVLGEMERAGQLRRGYFVHGLSPAQFARTSVVDQLRELRSAAADDPRRANAPADGVLLAATDPANPYGALVPWPQTTAPEGVELRRAKGAAVVLVRGAAVLYLDGAGRRLWSFRDAGPEDVQLAAQCLRTLAARKRGKMLRIEQLDGEVARRSAHAAALCAAGFSADHKGLVLDA